MADILQTIVAHKREEVARAKERCSMQSLLARLDGVDGCRRSLRKSLLESPTGIIAEFKRKSPSKGWINREARPEVVTSSYCVGGASACSILTDSEFFGGSTDDVIAARPAVTVPILRKDFMIDEYQIVEAKCIGADVVLLIAAALTVEQCRRLAHTAHQLGLETILEVHGIAELDYLNDDIDVVGVNNRNLGSFVTSVENSFRLADAIPSSCLKISESGISDVDTIRQLRGVGYRGFLIGERFMKTDNPGAHLAKFVTEINQCD
ncbi:MAG: indole-3-glycerol phosphate synthase TrpC [Candidatus Limisoma sp.]|nr:indole-3-glycerol phosphate synthase TrpC [Candidatus Limisoma sp.]